MTRGRRPNLTLEPSRQLQTQRAFRERKAAHLRHLEDTVKSQAEKILQLKKRLGEDTSLDEANVGEEESSSNETASSSPNKRRRVKSEHTTSDDVLKQALYTPPSTSTSPIPMSPLLASNSAPPTHTCSQCQRLRHQNAELTRLLADAEKQLAFYRPQSATTTATTTNNTGTSASSGSAFSENATTPSSPSSPVYNQRLPYTTAPNSAAASYAAKAPHHQQHTRIQWTQPLSPSLQMQYGSGPAPTPTQAQAAAYNNNNNYTRNEATNPYHAHQRYSTAPDSLDEHSSSRPTTAGGTNLPPAPLAAFTTNTSAPYHPPPPPPATQARSSPKCQPSRQCGPPQPATAPVGVQADQDKCCLGLFACDADGRIIV